MEINILLKCDSAYPGNAYKLQPFIKTFYLHLLDRNLSN